MGNIENLICYEVLVFMYCLTVITIESVTTFCSLIVVEFPYQPKGGGTHSDLCHI